MDRWHGLVASLFSHFVDSYRTIIERSTWTAGMAWWRHSSLTLLTVIERSLSAARGPLAWPGGPPGSSHSIDSNIGSLAPSVSGVKGLGTGWPGVGEL